VLFAGFLLFGLALEHHVRWLAVLVGVALFYAGLTGLTGILQTYMLEAYLVEPMNAMACVARASRVLGLTRAQDLPVLEVHLGLRRPVLRVPVGRALVLGGRVHRAGVHRPRPRRAPVRRAHPVRRARPPRAGHAEHGQHVKKGMLCSML
jgi:hypothetical protein